MKGDAAEDPNARRASEEEPKRDSLLAEKAKVADTWNVALQPSNDASIRESYRLSVMENGEEPVKSDVMDRLQTQIQHNARTEEESQKTKFLQSEGKAVLDEEQPASMSKGGSCTKTPLPPGLDRQNTPGAVAMAGIQTQAETTGGVALLDNRTVEIGNNNNDEQVEEVPKEEQGHLVNAELVPQEDPNLQVTATTAVRMSETDLPLSQRELHTILRDRRVCCLICAFISIIALLAIILSVIFLNKTEDSSIPIPTALLTVAPTLAPTLAPFPTASPISRMPLLKTLLEKHVDDVTVWDDSTSPQYQAINFLAYEDAWRPTKVREEVSDQLMLERYAMMVVYFSFGGPNWSQEAAFLDINTRVCDWQVQYCSWGNFCETYGVLCSGQFVSRLALGAEDINIVGTIPTEVGLLSSLRTVSIENSTSLSGAVPSELFLIETIESVSLRGNELSGTLPSSILQASNLFWLDLDENLMTGTIDNIANPALEGFALSNNLFSGSIPASLGNLKEATYIELGINQLTGTLPDSLSRISGLEYLSLFKNPGLTGDIPTSYYNSLLTNLHLEGTNLTGLGEAFCGPEGSPLPEYEEYSAECGGSTPESSAGAVRIVATEQSV
eukprot:CAMPEP_0113614066 /NCGR_PEP_ID=MMETSP0017_2-20120614/6969_1 /TAXON_ID=2856 /ORGANISM="Cylindrotheca closterium" /LENGTH=613 /DNA_ID=CAMNT_0000523211 /DNA_START=407 /DNA_END=2249 /DNA_ORIENTATION=+ /assembly_acc=CAM_ASM_000147